MRILGFFLGVIFCLGLLFFGTKEFCDHYLPDTYTDAFNPSFQAQDNIAAKCGIKPYDTLATTAMQKISDCLKDEYVRGYMDASNQIPVAIKKLGLKIVLDGTKVDLKTTGVTIDKDYPDHIDIGPDKKFDWVQVDCTSHLVYGNKIVNDYCDNGPILKVVYDPLESCWFIYKAHSKWSFFMDRGPESAFLRLLRGDH